MEIHLSDWEPLQGECSNHGSHEYHLGNFLNSPGSTGTPYQLYQKLCGWESDICYFSNSLHDYHIQPSSRVTAWQCHWLRNCHLGESLNSGFCSAGKLQSGHPEAGLVPEHKVTGRPRTGFSAPSSWCHLDLRVTCPWGPGGMWDPAGEGS